MKGFQILIGFLTSFVIISIGAALAIVMSGNKLTKEAILPCLGLGLLAACKEVRTMMQLPPLSNGNYNAIAQLMKDSNARKSDTDLIKKP